MLENILKKRKNDFGLVIEYDYRAEPLQILDLSENNAELDKIDVADASEFAAYIENRLAAEGSRIGIGSYLEDRTIYRSALFSGPNTRTVHLGIDLWVKPGVKVFAPLDGVVHSFRNNIGKGDYGPTVILEHRLDGVIFYTLYGHLNSASLAGKQERKEMRKGDPIGEIGSFPENGDYPPHLHFEIISDMQGKKGDFPGVAAKEEIAEFKKLCPDPNLILQIPGL